VPPSELPPDHEPFVEFLDDYFAECDEHLMGARRLLLALERSVGRTDVNTPVLDELFRRFHSLKGISGMVELRPAEELSHTMEEYLRALRRRDTTISVEGINALFDGTHLLEQVVGARRSGGPTPAIGPVVHAIAALAGGSPGSTPVLPAEPAAIAPSASSAPQWRFVFTPSRELVERGVRVDTIRARLMAIGEILTAAPRVIDGGLIAFDFIVATTADPETIAALREDGVLAEPVSRDGAVAPSPAGPAPAVDPDSRIAEAVPVHSGVAPTHFVRVDLTRLDELMRNVGDLVISRARLGESLARAEAHVPSSDWRSIQENAMIIDRQVRTLREGIMRVRLVPVGEIFRRMPFVVRDLARETGKRVRLELQGQSTEIDKFLIERMMDPVLHLVRNALSHGIEPAEERLAAGKPAEGTITLSASAAGETVTLDVADDGRGIDVAAVTARAARAGLRSVAADDEAGVLALLCTPGFSTRDESDRASGRGVGMAVVQSAIEELGGTLRLETTLGRGTRFIVELPVTLAITDALITRVGAETFAVPQGAVREVIEVPLAAMRALEQNEIAPYRGGALPIVRLSRLFGLDQTARDRLHVLVIGAGVGALGLAVDRIAGQREIVVRATTDPLVKVDGIAGATDLGDGRVVLILDPAALARRIRTRSHAAGRLAEGAA